MSALLDAIKESEKLEAASEPYNPRSSQFLQDVFVAHAKVNLHKFREACRVMAGALENLSRWELHYKTEGGIFDPKCGDFKRDVITEGISNPAAEAIAQVEKIFE